MVVVCLRTVFEYNYNVRSEGATAEYLLVTLEKMTL